MTDDHVIPAGSLAWKTWKYQGILQMSGKEMPGILAEIKEMSANCQEKILWGKIAGKLS